MKYISGSRTSPRTIVNVVLIQKKEYCRKCPKMRSHYCPIHRTPRRQACVWDEVEPPLGLGVVKTWSPGLGFNEQKDCRVERERRIGQPRKEVVEETALF